MAFMNKLKSSIGKAKDTATNYGATVKDLAGVAISKGDLNTKMDNMREVMMDFYTNDSFIVEGDIKKTYNTLVEMFMKESFYKVINKAEEEYKISISTATFGLNAYSAVYHISLKEAEGNIVLIEMNIDLPKDGNSVGDFRASYYTKSLNSISKLVSMIVYGSGLSPKSDSLSSKFENNFGTDFDDEILAFSSKFYSNYYIVGLFFNRTQWYGDDVKDSFYNEKIGFSKRDLEEKSLFYYNYLNDYILVSNKYIQIRARDRSSRLFTTVKIPIQNINDLVFVKKDDDLFELHLNKQPVFFTYKAFNENELRKINIFFEKLFSKQLTITDDELDDFIRNTLDPKVLNKVQSYFYNDEYFKYLATGLDSLTARDYLLCTNRRLLLINRELLGLGENIRSYEYLDITSISTKSLDGLLGTVLNAAFKQAHLEITVAGSKEEINNLKKIEADRVIEVFNQCKRAERQAVKTVTVQNQVPAQPDIIDQIKKLSELKDLGILSEEEFNSKKQELLLKL